jgi:hypothetical protein
MASVRLCEKKRKLNFQLLHYLIIIYALLYSHAYPLPNRATGEIESVKDKRKFIISQNNIWFNNYKSRKCIANELRR